METNDVIRQSGSIQVEHHTETEIVARESEKTQPAEDQHKYIPGPSGSKQIERQVEFQDGARPSEGVSEGNYSTNISLRHSLKVLLEWNPTGRQSYIVLI